MNKQKMNLRYMYWALPCMLLFAGCENGISQDTENTEPVELQIDPVVATTRSAIQEATSMQTVAVYADGADYTVAKANNYAVYTYGSNQWGNSGTDKIYLTNAEATIYGYYPTTTKYDADSNIPVTLVEGNDATAIIAVDNATSGSTAIASAASEVDCMWATKVVKVSNASGKSSVKLEMNHALAMVSFQVYKATIYQGAGSFTKFVVENTAGSNVLSKGTNPKMKITDGTLTPGAAQNAKYTRIIQSGYILTDDIATSKKFSILVLPINSAIGDEKIKATFTVDGADYSVNLKQPSVNEGKWLAGSNHLYKVKLSGTEVSITEVAVTKWTEVAGGDLEIK